MANTKNLYVKLFPVMLVFFTMGFVDLVGIATNYIKLDLGLSDSEANIFPSLVFFWFLIFSIPTGMLMNKIGRTIKFDCNYRFVTYPLFGNRVCSNVTFFRPIRNREYIHANIIKPASIKHYRRE